MAPPPNEQLLERPLGAACAPYLVSAATGPQSRTPQSPRSRCGRTRRAIQIEGWVSARSSAAATPPRAHAPEDNESKAEPPERLHDIPAAQLSGALRLAHQRELLRGSSGGIKTMTAPSSGRPAPLLGAPRACMFTPKLDDVDDAIASITPAGRDHRRLTRARVRSPRAGRVSDAITRPSRRRPASLTHACGARRATGAACEWQRHAACAPRARREQHAPIHHWSPVTALAQPEDMTAKGDCNGDSSSSGWRVHRAYIISPRERSLGHESRRTGARVR
jgi:hypothetical protein